MWRFLLLSVGLALLIGCGSSKKSPQGTVKGTITYKGQPVNGAALMLYSTTKSSPGATLPVAQDGTFSSADIPEGEYVVVVQPSSGDSGIPSTKGMDKAKAAEMEAKFAAMKTPPTIPIPEKYKTKEKSDLKMSVNKGEQTINLELKD